MDLNDNENIRPPDQVKKEKLINNDNYFFNELENPILQNQHFDLDKIIEISKNEFNSLQEEEEQKAIELICNQYKEHQNGRKNNFDNIKIQLNKIILFDRHNINYYELILSIIEMYEQYGINEYITNKDEFTKIFTILKSVRLPSNEIDNLKKIILFE
jgi:hypothetical protein